MPLRKTIITLLTLFGLTLQTQAINFVATNQFEVTTNDTLTSEHWVTANDIIIDGTIESDLFLAAVNFIHLTGNFQGNIWGLSGQSAIHFQGYAERNVRLATSTLVQVDGTIAGNLLAGGNTVKLTPNTHIRGDVVLYGMMSNLIEGQIDGQVKVAGQSVTLSAEIGGDLTVTANEILLLPGTVVMGDLYYTSTKELVVPQGMVLGKVKRVLIPPTKPSWAMALNGFLGALLLALPFTSLFPVTIAISSQTMRKSPLRCLSVGALLSIVLPILGISMLPSLPTLPSALILLSIWGILGYMGKILTAMVIGMLILRPKQPSLFKTVLAIALGLAIIYLGIAIPYTRTSVYLITSWLGMGALIVSAFRKRKMIIQIPKRLHDLEQFQNQPPKTEEK